MPIVSTIKLRMGTDSAFIRCYSQHSYAHRTEKKVRFSIFLEFSTKSSTCVKDLINYTQLRYGLSLERSQHNLQSHLRD